MKTWRFPTTPLFFAAWALLALPFLSARARGAASGPAEDRAADPRSPPGGGDEAIELSWPRVFEDGGVRVSIYQPQIESWADTRLESRAALAIDAKGSDNPTYGVVWLNARAEVDKSARVVTLEDMEVTKASFPTAADKEGEYLALIRKHLPSSVRTIALDHLEASFAISQAVKKQEVVPVKNDPPRIIHSQVPALLVLVDGEPVLRPVQGSGAERVINTRALLLKQGGRFYLFAARAWYQAAAVEGPWSPTASPPPELERIREAAVAAKDADLLEPGENAPSTALAVFVSTAPAELIVTEGKAEFLPIEGTQLLQVKNSDNAVFVDLRSNDYFVLVSGRWFKARSLDGPWAFVPGKELPPDFAKIPEDHPRGNVLVSVPGTPQAEEAVIANSIPQTATVKRAEAKLDVAYDGQPAWAPIEGTPLNYATNTPQPVLRVDDRTYYCVENGVWFTSTSPMGPWVAATFVPPVIYTIPPSSPLYYVTYVRIYGSGADVVYEGYTPGYLGSLVCPDAVVVYGTGYRYRPYVGTYWIGYPCTYGFGAGFACGAGTGLAFGFAAGAAFGTWLNPWWGPFDWGCRHGFHYTHVSVNYVSFYHRWGNRVTLVRHDYPRTTWTGRRWSQTDAAPFNPYSARARTGATPRVVSPAPKRSAEPPPRIGVTPPPTQRPAPREKVEAPRSSTAATRPGNVFAGRDGQVYRQSGSTWEERTGGGWRDVSGERTFQDRRPDLEQQLRSRDAGQRRFDGFRSNGGFRPGTGIPGGSPRAAEKKRG